MEECLVTILVLRAMLPPPDWTLKALTKPMGNYLGLEDNNIGANAIDPSMNPSLILDMGLAPSHTS